MFCWQSFSAVSWFVQDFLTSSSFTGPWWFDTSPIGIDVAVGSKAVKVGIQRWKQSVWMPSTRSPGLGGEELAAPKWCDERAFWFYTIVTHCVFQCMYVHTCTHIQCDQHSLILIWIALFGNDMVGQIFKHSLIQFLTLNKLYTPLWRFRALLLLLLLLLLYPRFVDRGVTPTSVRGSATPRWRKSLCGRRRMNTSKLQVVAVWGRCWQKSPTMVLGAKVWPQAEDEKLSVENCIEMWANWPEMATWKWIWTCNTFAHSHYK